MKNRLFVNNNTIILFLFIIGSILFIELNFRYWYRFLEQYMMFQTTGSYFQDRLAEPGGLNEYVTEFLSLAFIHPYGASVVIALLLGLISGCFFLYLKACGVRASMLAAILPSFLIWIYPQESIALLTMLAFVQKDPEAFKSYPISSEVQNRFLQFMKVARGMPPAALKAQFGDTYYYYAQFTPTPKRQ